jgi:hypothetical protein
MLEREPLGVLGEPPGGAPAQREPGVVDADDRVGDRLRTGALGDRAVDPLDDQLGGALSSPATTMLGVPRAAASTTTMP